MDLSGVNNVFFVGVGGIGMSALARYFNCTGKQVAGYDKTCTDLTNELEAEGIAVTYLSGPQHIPELFRNVQHTLVVYTPAVPSTLPMLNWFREQNFTVLKRAGVLGALTKAMRGICVAGTHGKTTVSAMISHLLRSSKVDCNAFLGGISQNYNTNLLVSDISNYVVVEADEYDRSFHQLNPYMAVITSVDPDHLDIYGDYNNLKESFKNFASLVRKDGCLVLKKGLAIAGELNLQTQILTYAINVEADYYADNIKIENGYFCFDLKTPGKVIKELTLGIPGRLNLENAVAALAIAHQVGCADDELREGMASFKGIKRRFEYHYKSDSRVYIDDYAHHPNEIKATLESIRELYPHKKITGVFQPHLYSRTRDFAEGFAESLALLDELLLLEIYPAREEPIPGVSSDMILGLVGLKNKAMVQTENLAEEIARRKPELLVTMGAGDIGELVDVIKGIVIKLDA